MSIKEVIISRFPKGFLLELDLSQLEIVAAAYLSQDKQLINDIVTGMDLHLIALSNWKKTPYKILLDCYTVRDIETEHLRTKAKQISFQLLYGSSAQGIATKFNLPLKDAIKFIEEYYGRYSELRAWQERNLKKIDSNKKIVKANSDGVPIYESELIQESGRRLLFTSEVSKWQPETSTFRPAQIKNYPVQSFATGDLFQLLLGKMFRYVRKEWSDGSVLMISTVHDSILFDIKESECIIDIAFLLKERAELITEDLKQTFNIDISPLKIKSDIKWGPNLNLLKTHL